MENIESDVPYRNLMNAMKDQELEDQRFFAYAHEAIKELNLYNSFYAQVLASTAKMLTEFALAEGTDSTSEMEIDEEYGKGINLYRVVSALNDYDETNDKQTLHEAVAYIYRELERRELWD